MEQEDIKWLYDHNCGWAATEIIQKTKMLEDSIRQRNDAISRAEKAEKHMIELECFFGTTHDERYKFNLYIMEKIRAEKAEADVERLGNALSATAEVLIDEWQVGCPKVLTDAILEWKKGGGRRERDASGEASPTRVPSPPRPPGIHPAYEQLPGERDMTAQETRDGAKLLDSLLKRAAAEPAARKENKQ